MILAQDERWRYALHMQVVRKVFEFILLLLVADGGVTRENLPLGGGQQIERSANTPYVER